MGCSLTVSIGTKTARGNARRADILEAALSIVCVKGVEKTRLSDVAESAGISVGSIQHHFGTRDDLLAATFEWFNDSSLAAWQAIATDSDARLQIHSLIRFAVFEEPGREQVTWPLWIEFWALANRNPVFRNQYDHIYSKWRAPFVSAVEQGVEQGLFRCALDIRDVVDGLTAEIEGLRVRSLLDPAAMSKERAFELLLREAELLLDTHLSLEAIGGDSALGHPSASL